MGKQTKNPGITREDKIKLVRDVMVRYPDYRRFGYNRRIIDLIKKQTADEEKGIEGIELTDQDITRCIHDIEKKWQDDSESRYSKGKIIDMLTALSEATGANIKDKRMIFQDIGKLEGHYKTIEINNYGNLDPENAKRLSEIFGEREKPKKEKEE